MDLAGAKRFLRLAFCLLFILLPAMALAEQLPIRTYTVADGLSHDRVQRMVRDERGFLWFCTFDGLSRFDGSHFVNYGVKDGLPAYTNNIIEARDRIYWIATNGGVSRFDPEARFKPDARRFTTYLMSDVPASNRVGVLLEDKAGNIWSGTDGGLFRLEAGNAAAGFHRVEIGIPNFPDERIEVQNIVEDAEGSLWISTNNGLLRRLPDGRILHFSVQPEQTADYIWALHLDKTGRLWIGFEKGLIVLAPTAAAEIQKDGEKPRLWHKLYKRDSKDAPQAGKVDALELDASPLPVNPGEAVQYTAADGLFYENVRAVYEASDGSVWIGTRGGGLYVFDRRRFVNYSSEQGINNNIFTLAEDTGGNIWAGTQSSGVLKISRSGFRSFGTRDGLGSEEVVSMFETQAGEFFAITNKWTINRFDGKKFVHARPKLPPALIGSSSGRWQMIQDSRGEWWVTTGAGLYRFPRVKSLEEIALVEPVLYTTGDGLADNNISRIFEDAEGDIWLTSYNPPLMLTRWERAAGAFHRYSEPDGLPPLNWGNAFARNAGDVWIGLHNGGLIRYRNGKFKFFKTPDDNASTIVQGLYFDRAGQLWVATTGGGAIIRDPAADDPILEPLPNVEPLSSNNLFCFVEDAKGHIYIGTARGINQLHLASGRVRHYSTNNGLINSEVTSALRDRRGALWFGTRRGISRLIPEEAPASSPVQVFISTLKIENTLYPVSEVGQTEVAGIELSPNQNQLQIDFFGLSFSTGGSLRYQYRLEGLDDKWSELTESRTFTANLKPGAYRFLVRAVTGDDRILTAPASVSFRILPPVWQRWWFMTLAAAAIAAVTYAFYRYRVRRVVEMERVRTRIATDLHDDIGASLSQIAILSEVVRQRAESNGKDSAEIEPLKTIAGTSREMIDAMSDIVWAINPHKDNLDDLLHRMRRFASDVLEAQDIDFYFQMPAVEGKGINLGTDLRREIYVIFKENINNIIKHSACTRVEIDIRYEHKNFIVAISDDGRGFDVNAASEGGSSGMGGNGLPNIRRRAAAMGGSFEIRSEIGKGTTTRLILPIGERLFG